MPRGKGIYEDEPRDQLEGAEAAQADEAPHASDADSASGEAQEPPD